MDEHAADAVADLILAPDTGRRVLRCRTAVYGPRIDQAQAGVKRDLAAQWGCRRRDLNPHALTGH
jgi:hypothetical protein